VTGTASDARAHEEEGPASRALTDPEAQVPSGTSIRFAVLVVVICAATASAFGFFWQVAHPAAESRVRACLAGTSSGLGDLVERLVGPGPLPEQGAADCVRPVAGPLTAWSLLGVLLLAAAALTGYLLTPWWTRHIGAPDRRRALRPLEPAAYRGQLMRLDELVGQAGLAARSVTFFLDSHAVDSEGAKAFGTARKPGVRIDWLLLHRYKENPTRFTDVMLHELAHIRNHDLLPTYLTLAAWRTFTLLLPAGYLTALLVSGAGPSVPDTRSVLVVALLLGLVLLSTQAVLRIRELHADATAASFLHEGTLRTVLDEADRAPAVARRRRWLTNHPGFGERKEVLDDARLLYRADLLSVFGAGVAIGIVQGNLSPTVFTALLGSRLGQAAALAGLGGQRALEFTMLSFGPASVLAALMASALACALSWRSRYGALAGAAPVRPVVYALPAALGMLAGDLMGFDSAQAGIWGALETGAPRKLAAVGLSAVTLFLVLALLFGWAAEAAAVHGRGGPRSRTAMVAATVLGAAAIAPMLCAWAAVHEAPLSVQLIHGPAAPAAPHIGHWPAVSALFFHESTLGLFNALPAAALPLALACAFVAVGRRRAPAGGRTGVRLGAVVGFAALGTAAVAAAGFGLVLSVRAGIGGYRVCTAGPYALTYFTRLLEVLITVCAVIAALLAARRARGAELSAAALTALATVLGSAVFVPQLIYIGVLGLHHGPVNPINDRVFYGIVGSMTPGRALLAGLPATALATLFPRSRPSPPRAAESIWIRALAGLLLCLLVVAVVYAGRCFFDIVLSPTPQLHPAGVQRTCQGG
jgi:Peptidase family M48